MTYSLEQDARTCFDILENALNKLYPDNEMNMKDVPHIRLQNSVRSANKQITRPHLFPAIFSGTLVSHRETDTRE